MRLGPLTSRASSWTAFASNVLGLRILSGLLPSEGIPVDQSVARQGFWDQERTGHQVVDAEGPGNQCARAADPEAHRWRFARQDRRIPEAYPREVKPRWRWQQQSHPGG